MKRTLTQNKHLHKLLNQLNIDKETKASMVEQYTNGRTASSSEMNKNECQNLINALENQKKSTKVYVQYQRQHNTFKHGLRRKIFSLMYELDFINSSNTNERKHYVINSWIKKKMNLNKKLNYLTVEELNKLIKQLRTVRRIKEEREQKQADWN